MSDHAEQPQHAPIHPENSGDAATPNAGHTAAHETVDHSHEAQTGAPQEEQLPISKVVMVGVVSLIIFAVGGAWSLKMRTGMLEEMNPTGSENIPAKMGAEEQGMVDQIPFELNHWVKDDRAAMKDQMEGYGWVDRKAGTIHIPIERAIELQLAEVAKPKPQVVPAPAPTPMPAPSESQEPKK
jgi:hypothetical protein